MACTAPNTELSIDFESLPGRHGFRFTKQKLVFCLNLTGTAVTGEVFDTNGGLISNEVRGTKTDAGDGVAFLRLNFPWAPARVVLVGMLFDMNPIKFNGRYRTTPLPGPMDKELIVPMGPDTGDTGTGTGQTT